MGVDLLFVVGHDELPDDPRIARLRLLGWRVRPLENPGRLRTTTTISLPVAFLTSFLKRHHGTVRPAALIARGTMTEIRPWLVQGVADFVGSEWNPEELDIRARRLLDRWVPYLNELGIEGAARRVLHVLLRHAGTVVSRDILALDAAVSVEGRSLDVMVSRARRAIPPGGPAIVAVRRRGYRLDFPV